MFLWFRVTFLSFSLPLMFWQHGLQAQNSPPLSLSSSIFSRLSRPPFNFGPLSYPLQQLTFPFPTSFSPPSLLLHIFSPLLFTCSIFFLPLRSFGWLKASVFLSALLFLRGNCDCPYGSGPDAPFCLLYQSFEFVFVFWEFSVILNFNLLGCFCF